ncbi:hypothetical protein [Pseudomonas sp. PDM31]|uniref:hypothetical protein n=1 Tax=Pseudomonas sp. PDM31 TaxID=2854778 RepID=UPI00210CCF35|nr:hypothetical protein [Pseudomonas sp. PDM31]
MSSIHDQAMNYVYQQVLQRLLGFFSRAERTALQLLIQRLGVAAGGMRHIGDFKVLAIQTGSRDSCYRLALLRAAQLAIATRSPATFKLRIASLRLNGVTPATVDNMHRTHSALFIYDDPRVEVLMVDDREVLPFCHLTPMSDAGRESNRLNLLLVGHRRAWDEPLDLWDGGYLATGEFYGQISRWEGGVDALISGDTPRQQKYFIEGLRRAAARAGITTSEPGAADYEGLFTLLDELGSDCFQAFYGEQGQAMWRPGDKFELCRRTTCVDIHDILVSNLEERWPLMTEFLGCQVDELEAQLRDSEHVSLAISVHLHGLHAQYVQGRSYALGVAEYLQRVLVMIRRKRLPERLCQQAMAAFGSPVQLAEQRGRIAVQVQLNFGLSEAQLVCLLFSPFANNAAGLERFLRQCHPGMLVAMPDLHRALQGEPVAEQITQWMVDVSGLPLSMIARLYRMGPVFRLADAVQSTTGSGHADDAAGAAVVDEWSAGH